MGPTAIRGRLRRQRRRLAVIAALLVCATALTLHHSGLAMGDGHHEMGMGSVVETCLATFTAVGTAVAAIAVALIALGRWRPPLRLWPSSVWLAPAPTPRARPGPALLSLLCVSRR
jgi:hypothetical protein